MIRYFTFFCTKSVKPSTYFTIPKLVIQIYDIHWPYVWGLMYGAISRTNLRGTCCSNDLILLVVKLYSLGDFACSIWWKHYDMYDQGLSWYLLRLFSRYVWSCKVFHIFKQYDPVYLILRWGCSENGSHVFMYWCRLTDQLHTELCVLPHHI